MKLPDSSIGVTDILSYRDCARRFAFGMRRHTAAGAAPQADGPSNSYGSAFHEAVAYVASHSATDTEAIRSVMAGRYGRWLAPEDLERLHRDLATYRDRDLVGVETVASESEMRVPLFRHEGEQIFYRFKIDRLYRSLTERSTFFMVDFKTSAHPKTAEEVHNDPQQSAYAWGIRELYPEIGRLVQLYDQLSFGVIPTFRTPAQLALIKEWLIENAAAILADETLEPTFNQWCAYCPILTDCPVVDELTDFALGHIAEMLPEDSKHPKFGGKELGTYVEKLEKVARAKAVLAKYDDTVRGALRDLPVDRRLGLGFKTSVPKVTSWSPEVLKELAATIPEFWEMVTLPKNAVARLPEEIRKSVEALADEHAGAPRMTRVKDNAIAGGSDAK